jgi:hypothetical protein
MPAVQLAEISKKGCMQGGFLRSQFHQGEQAFEIEDLLRSCLMLYHTVSQQPSNVCDVHFITAFTGLTFTFCNW